MELEDLKQQWQQSESTQKTINKNIMEIIHNKSYGPVAQLKRSFRRQMIAMTIVPIAIIGTNLQHIDKTLSSALFWAYIIFCMGVVAYAKMNFNVVKRMEAMDGLVKEHLEQQIALLESRTKAQIVGIRIALLFFILLTEVLPYFQSFKMLNTWHSLSPFIRFAAYAALLLFQYFVSRAVSHRKFGQHIAYLKQLAAQMD